LARRVVDGRHETNRFFWDYRRVLSGCYLDFYNRMTERAHRDGLVMRAENGYGSYPFPHIDGLAAYGRVDEPMGEFWFNDGGPWGTIMKQHYRYADSVRTAASAARIYGKPLVVAESLTIADGTRQGPNRWKTELDAQFCNGMNAAMIHLWSHQPDVDARPGLFTFDALNANLTWWEQSDAFLDYVGRCQLLLRQGRSVADFCYFFGEDTARFVPGRKEVRPALPAGYEFDGINAEVILSRLECRSGRAVLPGVHAYEMLVLPDQAGWPVTLPVLQRIATLVAEGLTVVGAPPGPAPGRLETSGTGGRRDEIVRSLWGDDAAGRVDRRVGRGRVVSGVPLADVVESRGLVPDVAPQGTVDPGWAEISWIHRQSADTDLYFLANSGTTPVRQHVSFRVTGRRPEAWDPLTGTCRDLPEWSAGAATTTMPLALEPAGSLFVVFRDRGGADPALKARDESIAPGGARNFPAWQAVLDVAGPWQVAFKRSQLGVVTFPELVDWTTRQEPEIRYYSGTAIYRTTFIVPESLARAAGPVALDLGGVNELATVRLNSTSLGTLWCTPWRVDVGPVLVPGRNELEIEVANLWRNRLIGDAGLPAAERSTRTNITVGRDEPLLPSGLIGPVRLICPTASGSP